MQAVREWRELYRGPKNGCRISRLKPCCTYSVRVRVRNSQFRHERFSTLPLAPPAALVRRWVPVPRPNKDPRPTRERALELVLGGPEAWWGKPTNEQGGVAFGTSGVAGIPRPATALGMLAARAGRTTRGAVGSWAIFCWVRSLSCESSSTLPYSHLYVYFGAPSLIPSDCCFVSRNLISLVLQGDPSGRPTDFMVSKEALRTEGGTILELREELEEIEKILMTGLRWVVGE